MTDRHECPTCLRRELDEVQAHLERIRATLQRDCATQRQRAEQVESQARAWEAVCDALSDVWPEWAGESSYNRPAIESVPALIRAKADRLARLEAFVQQCADAAQYPGDGGRYRGTSTATQLVHCQFMREEAEAQRDRALAAVETWQREVCGRDVDIDQLAELLRDVQFSSRDRNGHECCPICGNTDTQGHATDCRLSAALIGK